MGDMSSEGIWRLREHLEPFIGRGPAEHFARELVGLMEADGLSLRAATRRLTVSGSPVEDIHSIVAIAWFDPEGPFDLARVMAINGYTAQEYAAAARRWRDPDT